MFIIHIHEVFFALEKQCWHRRTGTQAHLSVQIHHAYPVCTKYWPVREWPPYGIIWDMKHASVFNRLRTTSLPTHTPHPDAHKAAHYNLGWQDMVTRKHYDLNNTESI